MVGSSKILTVSYGTFSCTLEGFDDSFGTMKAIAEYFRDLAADDRYFGAEPPVPDAQMLARIAEREVARRVEVQLDGKGVTLRTGDALPQSVVAMMQAASLPPDDVQMAPAPAVAPLVPAEAAAVFVPRPGSGMRQVITQTAPADLAQSAVPVMPPVAVAPIPAVQPMPTHAASQVVPPPRVAPVQTTRPMQMPRDLPQAPVAEQVPPAFILPAHPDADSVAAKLQRIRAVVGRSAAPVAAQEFAEDLGEIAAMPNEITQSLSDTVKIQSLSDTWNDMDENVGSLTMPVDATEQTDLADMDNSQQELADEVVPAPLRARVIRVRRADFDVNGAPTAALDSAAAISVTEFVTTETQADTQAAESFSDPDSISELDGIADLLALDGVEDGPQPDADTAPDFDDMLANDVETDSMSGPLTSNADLGDGTLPPDAEAELLEELAALERDALVADHHRANVEVWAETEVDLQDMTLAEEPSFSMENVMAATAQTIPAQVDLAPTTNADIDPDDMAALFDLPPGDDAVFDFSTLTDTGSAAPINALTNDAPVLAGDETAPLRLGRDLLEREPEADAEAMERIMSQTDAELNSPENSRRREAISQLKAAVAATEAARLMGETSAEAEADDVEIAFRDDLKQVVRPRRPVGEVSPDLRSERPRPAPLKLVASQRIDIPQPRPAPKSVMPVRPRRVSVQDDLYDQEPAAPVAPHHQAGSFAEFAASMGATELPDLLEAAAAYTSFVEGVEDFSRPQLMKKVQDMAVGDYSREDGLRSFGTLLRQGRIMKTSNGRFAVSEESRFNPERKSA